MTKTKEAAQKPAKIGGKKSPKGKVPRTTSSVKVPKKDEILARFLKAQDRLVYQTADLSLGSLSGMTLKGDRRKSAIDLDPDFQRRKRWTPEKQSALIESFLLNIPVPPIYLAEDELGQYSVVDGKQRLTAIHAFMTQNLRLKGLESFTEIEGMQFNELPEDLKNSLEIRPYVRVVTLLKQSDPKLKFEVFTRLNRGGEPMLAQELRKVAYRGPFSDLIFELAGADFLKKQLKITSDSSAAYIRMEDAEYVLRFFALRRSWRTFSGALRNELDQCMIDNQHMSGKKLQALKAEFIGALELCQQLWGKNAFQRHTGTSWRAQFLAGMYDAEMLAVAELTKAQVAKAKSNAAAVLKGTASLFKDPSFDKSVRQGTNTPSFVRNRVDAILSLLQSL
jgi:hypothetical protein